MATPSPNGKHRSSQARRDRESHRRRTVDMTDVFGGGPDPDDDPPGTCGPEPAPHPKGEYDDAEPAGAQAPPESITAPRPPPAYRFEALDSGTFFRTKYELTWLVQRMLVAGQPGVVGGPKKALKTSIDVDLAVSLGSGTPFLGRFEVYRRHRVVIISGESGEAVLQDVGRRVCAARGIEPQTVDVHWSFRLPQVASALDRRELSRGLQALQVSVCILDPLYLAMLSGVDARDVEAGNLYHMGPLLSQLARACLDVGATPILSHHARKSLSSTTEPMDLEDLSFAGIAEYARQWLLVNRRAPFDPDTGSSRLWLSAGGSAGQSGCWAVDVEEGVIDDHFRGRKWQVSVCTAGEERQGAQDRKARERADRQAREDGTTILNAIDALTADAGRAVFTEVRARSGLGGDRMTRAVLLLKAEGVVAEVPVEIKTGTGLKAARTVRGLARLSGLSVRPTVRTDSPDSD
jgi:replicative DNA helicase